MNTMNIWTNRWTTERSQKVGGIESSIFTKKKSICQNYTLEWFSEAGSASIRSAVKFYVILDVRIFFQLLQKNIFSIDQKKFRKFSKKWKFSKFSKNRKSSNKKSRDFLWKCSTFSKISKLFFWSIEKIFLKKLKKNPDINIEVKFHCGSNGSTPSLWKSL